MHVYALLGINMVLLLTGQILWKLGVCSLKNISFQSLLACLISPLILTGLLLYGVATIIWLILLSREQFSIIYPLQSLSYILGVAVASTLFKEQVPLTRWLGVLVIIVGAFLITKK